MGRKKKIDVVEEVQAPIPVIDETVEVVEDVKPSKVTKSIDAVKSKEDLMSILLVLIGVNSGSCRTYLEAFQKGVGITQYVDVPNATAGHLAKLAGFISKSISSSSQSLASKTPSIPVSVTF